MSKLTRLEQYLRNNPLSTTEDLHMVLEGVPLPLYCGRAEGQSLVGGYLTSLRKSLQGTEEALHGTWVTVLNYKGEEVNSHKEYKVDSLWAEETSDGPHGKATLKAVLPGADTVLDNLKQVVLASQFDGRNSELSLEMDRAYVLLKATTGSVKRLRKLLAV